MRDEQAEDLGKVRGKAREAADALKVQAADALALTRQIEDLTGGTSEGYAGMRTRVEAAEALRQARLLVRTLEHLDERVHVSG